MKCANCGSDDWSVLDTRKVDNLIRRRRECKVCGERITTYEADKYELVEPRSRFMKRIRKQQVQIFLKHVREGRIFI